jgi:tetratricopeptide (TPR) repeat protein
MAMSIRWAIALIFVFVLVGSSEVVRAQQDLGDRPGTLVPLRPESRRDLDRREARKLYAQALLCQREDRLIEALTFYEKARQLDPKAPAIHQALVPLYLALGRVDDSLASCKRTLELDPGDHETWFVYGRQLKDQGQTQESIAALQRGVACPSAKEQLDLLVQMYFDLGNLQQEARDFTKAEAAFREVIKILIDHREALLESGACEPEQIEQETAKTYERIGEVCTQAGAYERAVAAYLQAQKRDPDRAGRLGYNLAQVYLAQTRPLEALRHLNEYLRTQPQGAEAYELMISILQKLRRDSQIVPALEQAAARDEHNVPLHLLLARQYGQAKQWTDAERLYLKLAETTPSQDVYRGLFRMYLERSTVGKVLDLLDQTLRSASAKENGEDDDAAAEFSPKAAAAAARARSMLPVLRDEPELVKALLKEVERDLKDQRTRYRTTMRFLAILAARTRQVAIAEQLYRACLPTITEQTEAEIYTGLLEVLAEQRKYQAVVDFCRQGQKKAKATNLILFQVKMAPALLNLGKVDDAIAAIDEAVKLADDQSRLGIQRLRIEILRQAEQYDRAIKECESLLQELSRPGQIRDIRHSLSNVYTSAKEHAKAEEQLRLILEADPNDATANNDLGYIMADQNKNLNEAEKLIRKAIDLDIAEKKHGKAVSADGDDANAAYIDSLGWVLFRQGKLEAAREQLEKAIKLLAGEDDPVVWDHLGDVYFRLDQTKQARSAWGKAVQLYEQERRRKSDDRYKEIRGKLETLGQVNKAR